MGIYSIVLIHILLLITEDLVKSVLKRTVLNGETRSVRIKFLDCWYPEVFTNPRLDGVTDYRTRQSALASLYFGTGNAYSKAFTNMGWDAEDIIGNDPLFWDANKVFQFLMNNPPDILYCQDLCFLSAEQMKQLPCKKVGQISSKWPGDDVIRRYDLLFTSFPHYLGRFRNCGVRGEFLPIAFISDVLSAVTPVKRTIDVGFIGGLGDFGEGGYWSKGTEIIESVANNIPGFEWYGYFIGNINKYPNLARTYKGKAFGIDMYNILAKTKIVINRHGEVSEGYTNNMRCFEATGMGAVLFTEYSKNFDYYFKHKDEAMGYGSISDLLYYLVEVLNNNSWRELLGERGQARTLKDHTYTKRLAEIEPTLKGLIKCDR